MTLEIRPDDARLAWEGCVDLVRGDTWVQAFRLPRAERDLFMPGLVQRAGMPSGVRIVFRSETRRVAGRLDAHPEMTPLDLVVDGALAGTAEMAGRGRFAFENLPRGPKRLELWLPNHAPLRIEALELDDGAPPEPAKSDARPRWLTYGSSITQCRQAASPTRAWPAMVARDHGLDLTSFGFGGQCHLDPMVARVMRDRPAELLSMCVGINIYGGASLGPRAFRPAIIGFARTLRDGHPESPLVVISPIYGARRELQKNAVGFTLPEMREEVETAVAALRTAGDRHIHYWNGLDLFGPDLASHLPDDLHPDAEGYQIIGRRFSEKLRETGLVPSRAPRP